MLPKVHKPDNFESRNSQKLSFTNIQDLCFNFVWYESFRRKKHHRTNQGSNFLGGSFSNRDNVRVTQSNLEAKVNLCILKDDFPSRTNPSIVTSIAPMLLDLPNETSSVFPALKSTSHFMPQSTASRRSDSISEANSSCCHRPDVWSHLE